MFRWGSGVADHVSYEAGTDVTDFQIAFGALPNHHCILDKLDYVYPHPPYDDSMVDRFTDPGAGAFTYVSRGSVFIVGQHVLEICKVSHGVSHLPGPESRKTVYCHRQCPRYVNMRTPLSSFLLALLLTGRNSWLRDFSELRILQAQEG